MLELYFDLISIIKLYFPSIKEKSSGYTGTCIEKGEPAYYESDSTHYFWVFPIYPKIGDYPYLQLFYGLNINFLFQVCYYNKYYKLMNSIIQKIDINKCFREILDGGNKRLFKNKLIPNTVINILMKNNKLDVWDSIQNSLYYVGDIKRIIKMIDKNPILLNKLSKFQLFELSKFIGLNRMKCRYGDYKRPHNSFRESLE